jgi:hypothetical protein
VRKEEGTGQERTGAVRLCFVRHDEDFLSLVDDLHLMQSIERGIASHRTYLAAMAGEVTSFSLVFCGRVVAGRRGCERHKHFASNDQ